MNIIEVKKTIPCLLRQKVVPFLWGRQGVGKTQVVRQIAQENNLQYFGLYLGTQADPGDVLGLPVHNPDGTVKHARPEWFPTEGRGILHLDELNRAHPDLIQAMFSLLTERRIHTHVLPEGWSIVASGNYQSNQFNVTDTSDAAWVSRFCHIDFRPSPEEFTEYLEDSGMDVLAAFCREQTDLVSKNEHDTGDIFQKVTFDNRSFKDMLGRLETEPALDPVRFEVYSGLIGKTAAAAYLTFKKTYQRRLSGRGILKNFPEFKGKVEEFSNEEHPRFDLLDSAVMEILVYLKAHALSAEEKVNLQDFILTLPLEMALKIFENLLTASPDIRLSTVDSPDFVKQLDKKRREGRGRRGHGKG